jgi:hypothetical protein
VFVTIEPLDGSELDRLVTALLSATGVVHRAIEAIDDPSAGGERVIDAVAERVSAALAPFAEHYSDDELGELTGAVAHITLLLAADVGVEEYFRPEGEGPGAQPT